MQNTILLMQRELKVEKGENVRMLAVLRDKPEWLAAVQATRAEAASVEERLKQEQKKATEHRLNGGGGGVNETQMEDSTTTTTLEVKAQGLRTQPSNSAGVTVSVLGGEASVADRTAESGASVVVVVSVEHATNGKPMDVVSNNNNNNNGQTTTNTTMMTRKRTRSSVASSVVGGGGVGVGSVEDEEMMLEEENEVAKLCGGGSLKRNRYSVVNSDKSGAALVVVVPRTRGQLQLAEAEKKLEVMEEGEEEPVEVTENGGGGVAGEAITELQRDVGDRDHSDPLRLSKGGVVGVLFSNNNNNNNNNGNNKLCATPEEEEEEMENGRRAGVAAETSTEAIKCKLENGSSGGGIELNNV